jgi:DNA modification methylase
MKKRVRRKPRRMLAESLPYVPAPMAEVTAKDYRVFRTSHASVAIEDVEVKLTGPWPVLATEPPKGYAPEKTTVWSFPDRGDWATHAGNYRGNWSPYIPRNLIIRYTKPGDLVLDQMVGSGTTLVECKLLGRRAIGVDINPDAIMVARDRLNFSFRALDPEHETQAIQTYVGDARSLDIIPDGTVDLVATHPPYASIVSYSRDRIRGDLSSVRGIDFFIGEISKIARESMRVLRPGGHCAILMGDTRRHRHFVPISSRVFQSFLEAGFLVREDIMKIQHKMKSTRELWSGSKYDFLLLAHEHLFVFRKLAIGESPSPFRESARWWAAPTGV